MPAFAQEDVAGRVGVDGGQGDLGILCHIAQECGILVRVRQESSRHHGEAEGRDGGSEEKFLHYYVKWIVQNIGPSCCIFLP